MGANRQIKRIVEWSDILHATAHNSAPQFESDQYTADYERERIIDMVGERRCAEIPFRDSTPAYFQKVLERLRALAMTKSLLIQVSSANVQELRILFSSVLFATEYLILELGHTAGCADLMTGKSDCVEAVKAAGLIFTFHGLRDLAITASFFDDLVRRLHDGLCGVFDDVFCSQNPIRSLDRTSSAPLLLWLCLTGWQASAIELRRADKHFFLEKAVMICRSVNIASLELLVSHMSRVVLLDEYHLPACRGLWADVKTYHFE